MKFEEAIEWIEECNKLGSVLGLDNMENLMNAFQYPDEKLNIIHVAGTNGKGSVSTFISEIGKVHGLKVGRYVSPTIFCYQERFQINNRNISKDKLAAYLTEIREVCELLVEGGKAHPTSFEIETLLALLYFAREGCDLVVLEVGMGGRLDATNIIKHPKLCVMTSISMDHMQFLGNDLETIAKEKCGIIKPNTAVVSALQDLEVEEVIQNTCKEHNVTVSFVDETAIEKKKQNTKKQSFVYKQNTYEIGMIGSYQIENACLAIETMRIYQQIANISLSQKKIEKALLQAKWPGRFQIIGTHPTFVVDGAHNVDGAKKLKESIDLYFTNKPIIYIMGMFRDKEYEKVIDITCKGVAQIITVATPNNPRALSSLDLAMEVQKVNPHVTTASSIDEAVEMAYLFAGKEAVIVSFGSLSFLGKLIDLVSGNQIVRSDNHGQ